VVIYGELWVCDHCSKIPVFLHVFSILFLIFLSSLPFCLVFLVGSFVCHLIPSSLHIYLGRHHNHHT
jgi:hypothetical protein